MEIRAKEVSKGACGSKFLLTRELEENETIIVLFALYSALVGMSYATASPCYAGPAITLRPAGLNHAIYSLHNHYHLHKDA